MPPSGRRNCRRSMFRLRPTITRRFERASPVASEARSELGQLVAGQQTAVDLELAADLLQPGRALGQVLLGAAQVDDAGAAEPALGLDQVVQVVPQAERLD